MDYPTFMLLQNVFERSPGDVDRAPIPAATGWAEVIQAELGWARSKFGGVHPIVSALEKIQGQFTTLMSNNGVHVAVTTLRPISKESVTAFLNALGPQLAISDPPNALPLVMAAWAQLAVELRYVLAMNIPSGSSVAIPVGEVRPKNSISWSEQSLHMAFEAEVSSYISWQTALEASIVPTQSEAKDLIRHYQQRFSELDADAQARNANLSSIVIDLQGKDKELREAIEKSKADVDMAAENFQEQYTAADQALAIAEQKAVNVTVLVENTKANYDAFTQAIEERFRIGATRKLWNSRAIRNGIAFAISAGLLTIFLLVIPVCALLHLDSVIVGLRHIGDVTIQGLPDNMSPAQLTVVTISRLVVITVPLALYFWVIRLIVRFNMRSLALMDDAQQRKTMMETYFHLIEQNAAVREDRALILNALFRPGPGQVADNVDPPNFVDLVEKAMAKP
jgi:hypothetical protein